MRALTPRGVAALAVALAPTPAAAQQTIFELFGDSSNDHFGSAVAVVGDLDGDDLPEILVGAPDDGLAGGAWAYSGATGLLIRTWTGIGARGDAFGSALAGGPDVDGDQLPEVLIGAPLLDSGQPDVGRLYLRRGSDGGGTYERTGGATMARYASAIALLDDLDGDGIGEILVGAPGAGNAAVLSGASGNPLFGGAIGQGAGSLHGASVAGGADLDGDGVGDFVVGAPTLGAGGTLFAYSGATGGVLFAFAAPAGSLYLGSACAILDDVDGDLRPDVAVGAPHPGAGRVHLVSGATGTEIYSVDGPFDGARFGSALAVIADLGLPELVVGAPADGASPPRPGVVHVLSGLDGTVLDVVVGQSPLDRFGAALATGDFDGDGRGDLAIGAPNDDGFQTDAGRVLVRSGFTDCNANGLPDILEIAQGAFDCNGNGVLDVCETSDCNGNGLPDYCDFPGQVADCNLNGVLDACEIAEGLVDDCDLNGVPDQCQAASYPIETELPTVGPVVASMPLVTSAVDLPPAAGPLLVHVMALGGFAGTGSLDVELEGFFLGTAFVTGGVDCAPNSATLDLEVPAFDRARADGTVVFTITPSAGVSACLMTFVTLQLEYDAVFVGDCDGDGSSDVCELVTGTAQDADGNGVVDDCWFARLCTSTPNSTGAPALISTFGSSSVSANALTLLASPLPSFSSALFIYSPDEAQVPLGEGFLCVGSTTQGFINRLPPGVSNVAGFLTHALDVTAPPDPASQILPGSAWIFQAWYRDLSGGPSGFNLSDAMRIFFVP